MQAMTRLGEKDRRFLWHPFTQMQEWMRGEPLIVESGKGAILRDIHGNEYIDANASIWTNLHGHRHPQITRAIKAQLDRIAHSSFLGLSNVPAIELAEKLVGIAPRSKNRSLSRVFYSDDGSTAMEAALKMAFQYWRHKKQSRRKTFVAFANAYHGDTLGAVSVGGIARFRAAFAPLLFDVIRVNEIAPLKKIFARRASQIAAVCIEPLVQGAAGMRLWRRGLLAELRELCDRHEVLLIADEVLTGFGRTGTMFACEQEQVVPDLMALAKGLTGGYLPLAATLATEEIFNAFLGEYSELKTFFHGHSYTGNQLGCSAALANLRLFEQERTLQKLKTTIVDLQCALESCRSLAPVGEIRHIGMIGAVELFADASKKTPFAPAARIGWRVCDEMRRHGVLTRPLGDTVVILPPYCISKAQLETIFTALRAAIRRVCQPR
jgi:adenosylmethionine-8-amino-7-oxononanoate aminotransferase